jgi:beta-lactamase class A
MADSVSRRALIAGALLTPSLAQAAGDEPFAKFERSGTRIGLAALDTGSGRRLVWHANQRFLMCSTFKLSLAALMLWRAERQREDMEKLVDYRENQLLLNSPATTKNLGSGMTVATLCEAAIIYSDNTAANLLLERAGGPPGLTAFWRRLGDKLSRLDRMEPELNLPDGEKDTTTPAAMLHTLQALLLGKALSRPSRARLSGWMHANTTGGALLKAGLPPGWKIGDKTGRWASKNIHQGSTNDIGIVTPRRGRPILVACYTQGGPPDDGARSAVLAEVGRIIATEFA